MDEKGLAPQLWDLKRIDELVKGAVIPIFPGGGKKLRKEMDAVGTSEKME